MLKSIVNMTHISYSKEDTCKIASKVAKELSGGDILALRGDLGSGKTTFTQGLAKAFGVTATVASPTFVILKKYSVDSEKVKEIYHMDSYRLLGSGDLEAIGFYEIIQKPNAVLIVEWPEKIAEALDDLGKRVKTINFKYLSENSREISYDIVS